jgi:hypothetical protein
MTEQRMFLVYIHASLTDRGGPDTGWRLVPLPKHRAPCEHIETASRIACSLVGNMAHRRSPYDWTFDDEVRDFAFCYREVIRDRTDTPAYACAAGWVVEEVHRDDDCIKHGPVVAICTGPQPMQGDVTVLSAPIVRAP